MYKWVYDKLIKEYSKKTKEELIQHILSLEEIECSDRAFANQCEAGAAFYYINKLFSEIEKLNHCMPYRNLSDIFELNDKAKREFAFITEQITNMNDSSRTSVALNGFKQRVANAKDKYDSI